MTRMIAAALLLAAGVLALAPAPADAQPMRAQTIDAHGLRFALTPGRAGSATIAVRRGAREIVRVARSSGAYDAERRSRWVFLLDANFDGYPDIWVLDNDAMANVFYTLELYDPAAGRFVAVPGFDQLSSPQIDDRYRQIATAERGGCCSHSAAIYRWRGAALEAVAEWGDGAPEIDWPWAHCFVREWRRERRGEAMVDLPDRYTPMHVFAGERAPAADCVGAEPPPAAPAAQPRQ